MSATLLSQQEIAAAEAVWATYLQNESERGHDGEVAGIDPHSGEVTLGRTIAEIVERRSARGQTGPLMFKRIGSLAVYRKGHTGLLSKHLLEVDFTTGAVRLSQPHTQT